MSAGTPGHWDPGLQPERTSLAWQRTGLALSLASTVALREGVVGADPVVLVLSATALVAGGLVVHRCRAELPGRIEALRAGGPLPPPGGVRAVVVALVCLAAATVTVLLR